jgi:hypothetical protein
MSVWGAVGDVASRLSYATIDADSEPNTTEVQQWLDDAEAQIKASLESGDLPTTFTAGSNAISILKEIVVDYAEARCRLVWASNGLTDQYAEDMLERFHERREDIADRPNYWAGRLKAGSPTPQHLMISGTATQDVGGRSVTSSDLAPVFTRSSEI